MRANGVIYVVTAAVLAVFALANWQLLMQSVEMNLLVARVQTPLVVVFLLFAGILLLLDFAVHAVREHSWIRERRALARDLEIARLRAEQDMASRTGLEAGSVQRDLAIIRTQLERVVAAQSALLRQAPVAEPDGAPIEPELIPPRGPGRGVH